MLRSRCPHSRPGRNFSWYIVAGTAYSSAMLRKAESRVLSVNQHRVIRQTFKRKMLPQEALHSGDSVQIAAPQL